MEREIRGVHEEDYCVHGARKIWNQLNREGITVARSRSGDCGFAVPGPPSVGIVPTAAEATCRIVWPWLARSAFDGVSRGDATRWRR